MKLIAKTAALVAFSAASVALMTTAPAQALDFSFRGTFANDNDVQLFNFTVGAPSSVTLKTLSYAGGAQADGTVVPRGGFDPILALFDASGTFINSNDDGNSSQVPTDPFTRVHYDTFLSSSLNPGNYTVAVTQYDNFHKGNLSDGFRYDGPSNANFRSGFVDVSGVAPFNQRTNSWAFDVLNVAQATTPPSTSVPTPALLPGLIGLGVGVLRKRKARAAEQAIEA